MHNGLYTPCEIISSRPGTTHYCARRRKIIINGIRTTMNNTHSGFGKTKKAYRVHLINFREGSLGALFATLTQLAGTTAPIMTT